jgi:hypothetical protein
VDGTRYSQAVGACDRPSILAWLSDDVTIRVAVHDELLRSEDTAGFLFGALTQELTPFELVGEIVEGDRSVVLFETSLGGDWAHVLNVVAYQLDGLRWGIDCVLSSVRHASAGRRGDRPPHASTPSAGSSSGSGRIVRSARYQSRSCDTRSCSARRSRASAP